jgi:aryl-alcohol dehydrogenase-like predicted oxidoreductase
MTLFDIAASKGMKPGQIALAWLLHKGDDKVAAVGRPQTAASSLTARLARHMNDGCTEESANGIQ